MSLGHWRPQVSRKFRVAGTNTSPAKHTYGGGRSYWRARSSVGLFNATVLPIKDLGIRGVLYYQGENQAFNRWTRYEYTFPKIPVSFRKAFGDENLPFGCISQPGWGTFGLDPEVATIAEGYAIVRDIQNRALANDRSPYHAIGGSITGRSLDKYRSKLKWHIKRSLSNRQKQVIEYYLKGKTEREIAAVLGITQQVVNIYKHRAIKRLHKIIVN